MNFNIYPLIFIICWKKVILIESIRLELPKIFIGSYSSLEYQSQDFDNFPTEVSIGNSSDFGNLPKLEIDSTQDQLIVPSHFSSVTLVCNASYPIQWIYDVYEESLLLTVIRTRTFRSATNIYDPSTFLFTTTIDLMGDASSLTGLYTCEHTDESLGNKYTRDLYVYWQGVESPPYLVLAGMNIRVKTKDEKTIELPCYVTQPDVYVTLFKQNLQTYEKLQLNESITFHPRIGFILDLIKLSNPFGSYKCIVGNEDVDDDENEDSVYFHVLPGIEKDKPDFPDIILANTSLEYDPMKRQLQCCSMTERPPSLHTLYCQSPVDCRMRAPHLYKYSNRKDYNVKNGSCTVKQMYVGEMGIFRCKGEGIDISRNFITPYTFNENHAANYTVPIYFTWSDIDPHKMISLHLGKRTPSFNHVHDILYNGEEILMTCDASHFYFADGTVHWALNWKNNSVQFLDESYSLIKNSLILRDSVQQSSGHHYYATSTFMQTIELKLEIDMKSITCFAPVYNSTDWINKTFNFDIKVPERPKIDGPNVVIEHWKVNETEKIIYCSATGDPLPRIRFRKNNRTLNNQINYAVKIGINGTGTVKVKRTSYDSQGTYDCIASNFAGKVSKSYKIYIIEANKGGLHGVYITVIAVLSLGFIGGIGFLIWKLQLQKKVISHLNRVVFRDLSRSQDNQNQNNQQVQVSNIIPNPNNSSVPIIPSL